jgi:Spy/CpxP family protein refolding chaperone
MAITMVLALLAAQEDPVERSVNRLREQLNLTEEQLPKVREIEKKRNDDLRAALTDEQKQRMDQGGRGGRGGDNNQRGGGGFGGLPSTDELKTQLSLTEAQVAKVNEVRDGVREQFRSAFQNRGGGRPNPEEMRATFDKIRTESNAKIREALTDEQKPKFDEIVKAAEARTATPGGEGRQRGPSTDDRVARAMEVLKFEKPEEAEAVKGLVRRVVEAQEKLEANLRENRGKLEEISRDASLSDEAVGSKMDEVRKPQKDLEKTLADARAALVEVLTSRQELELIRRGVLR